MPKEGLPQDQFPKVVGKLAKIDQACSLWHSAGSWSFRLLPSEIRLFHVSLSAVPRRTGVVARGQSGGDRHPSTQKLFSRKERSRRDVVMALGFVAEK